MESRQRDLVDDLDPAGQMRRLTSGADNRDRVAGLLRGQRDEDIAKGGVARKDAADRLVRGIPHAW